MAAGGADGPQVEASAPVLPSDLEQALRLSEQRYRRLVEASALDVFRTTADGLLVTDMPGWRSVTGDQENPIGGLAWLDDVLPQDRDRVRQRWLEGSVATGEPFDCEYRIGTADGGWRVILARAVPLIENRGGQPVISEWIGTSEDVTAVRASAARTERMQRVTEQLAGALATEGVVHIILTEGRAALDADFCGLGLLDASGTELRWHSLRGYQPAGTEATRPTVLDPVIAPTTLPGLVFEAARPRFVRSPAELAALLPAETGRAFLASSPESSWACLPLATTGDPVGILSFGFRRRQGFPTEEQAFLVALAGQCAQALERARLFESQQSTAQVLQRALLPDRAPALPGWQLTVRHQFAAGSQVGGDWWDVVPLSDGRVAVVLGDVVGRGVRAAAFMGQIRSAVRAYAAVDPDPATVLCCLDRLFATLDVEEVVTLCYAVLDPGSGWLELANAGHPPPLLVQADGTSRWLEDGASTLLGVFAGDRVSAGYRLAPGTTLVLYSDGLVENRERSLGQGMVELAAVTGRARPPGGDLDQMCDRMLAGMIGAEDSDDDVSMLALRRNRN